MKRHSIRASNKGQSKGGKVAIPGPGPWAPAHGPWPMGPGPWALAHGPWPMGPWPMGPWPMGPFLGPSGPKNPKNPEKSYFG